MEESLPRRKRPAHFPLRESFNLSQIVLVTVCTAQRRPLLARHDAVSLLIGSWQKAGTWLVGRYVILPDHIHLFCAPSSDSPPSLSNWVKFWKALVALKWPWREEQPIWQPSFWDRQLRNGEHYSTRWDYVRNNPVRHNLVANADDWPWQGELNTFQFHDKS